MVAERNEVPKRTWDEIARERYTAVEFLGGNDKNVFVVCDDSLPEGRISVAKYIPRSMAGYREVGMTSKYSGNVGPDVHGMTDQGIDEGLELLLKPAFASLDRCLAKNGTLSLEKLRPIASSVAKLLYDMEMNGDVHLDVKPSNVLLYFHPIRNAGYATQLRLADFGFAQSFEDAEDKMTGRPMFYGTLGFIAPEFMTHGTSHSCPDMYGFGMLLYKIVGGTFPLHWSIRNRLQYRDDILTQPVDELLPIPLKTDPVIATIIKECRLPTSDRPDSFKYILDTLACA
jgi:hypothetical protein